MQSDKENLHTPKDAKKRPSLSSPFASGTPSTRPNPRKIGRTLQEPGDQNLDATQVVDDTFNVSAMVDGLPRVKQEKSCSDSHGMVAAHQGDINIEETYLEETLIHEVISAEGARPDFCCQGSITPQILDKTVSTANLKTNLAPAIPGFKPTERSIPGDPNIEESYLERTLIHEEHEVGNGQCMSLRPNDGAMLGDTNIEESYLERTMVNDVRVERFQSPDNSEREAGNGQCISLKPTEGDVLGDANIEETYYLEKTLSFDEREVGNAVDDDKVSYEKLGVTSAGQEERCAAGMETIGVQLGNDNIDAPFLEKSMVQCGAGLLEQSLLEKTLAFSDQYHLRLPINQPVTQGGHIRRIADSNREDTAGEATLCEMDFTQGNVSVNPLWREMLEMNDSFAKEGPAERALKTAQAAGPNLEEMLLDVTTQQATENTQDATPTLQKISPRPDFIGVTVEAVVMCERYDTHKKLKEVPTLAQEIEVLGIRLDEDVNTEIMGTVNVSALSDGSERLEKEHSCVSRRASNFSMSAAMKKNPEGVDFTGDNDLPVDVDIYGTADQTELVFQNFGKRPNVGDADETTMLFREMKSGSESEGIDDTQLIFDEFKRNIDSAEPAISSERAVQNANETIALTCDMDISAVVDATSDAVNGSAKFAGDLPEVFPSHLLTAEVEGRHISLKNVATRIPTEATLEQVVLKGDESPSELVDILGKPEFDTSLSESISIPMKSTAMLPKVVAMENIEEVEEGEYFDYNAGSVQCPGFEMQPSLNGDANLNACECIDSPLSDTSKQLSQRKYNLNDSEISFMIQEINSYERTEQGCITEVEQYKKNLAALEMQKAELHNALRAVSAERDAFKEKASVNDAALAETNRKLGDMMRAKELAEKTVADYEFVVEELKRSHLKQKQDLQAKLFAQDEELEMCHAQIRTQKELSRTYTALSEELSSARERLEASECARETALKRCEELGQELDVARKSAASVAHMSEKILTQKEELDRCYVQIQAQQELSITSAKLSAEISLSNERLVRSETAREEAIKRCEELAEELDLARKSEVSAAELSEKVAASERDMSNLLEKMADLNEEIKKKDEALSAASEKSTVESMNLQKQLTETTQMLEKLEEEVKALQSKLKEAEDNNALLREMQLTSELELIKAKDEMEASKKNLEESAEAYTKARQQYSVLEKDLSDMRFELDEKNRLHQIDRLAVEELKTACALAKEQLCNEKAASDSAKIEITRLQSVNVTVTEELACARTALAEAEQRATAAEDNLSNHIKCHTEELNKRVTDLEVTVNSSLAEKTSLEKRLSEQLQRESVQREELQRGALAIQKLDIGSRCVQKPCQQLQKTTELVSVLETQLADTKEKHTEELQRLQRHYDEKVVEVEKIAGDFAEMQRYVKSLEEERDRLKDDLALANKRLDEGDVILGEFENLKTEKITLIAQCASLKKDLVASEEMKEILGRDLEELRLTATQSDAEIATLRNAKASLVKEWEEKEEDYKEKLREAEKRMTVIPELESSIELLKTEASALGQELTIANGKLQAAVESKEETRNALTALEQQYITLQLSKKAAEKEYEESKKQFEARLAVAQKTADELTEEVSRLEDLITVEQNAAKEKVSAMYAEVYRLEAELEETKIARTEVEVQLSKENSKCNELEVANRRLEAKVADALATASPEQEKELCELKRLVELKEKEIDRLGNLCDEFDEIEADYREKIFTLCRERDALKVQVDPSSVKEVPNLRAALYEGVKTLTPECSVVQNEENEAKLKELQEMVKELSEEKSRIEKSRTIASAECEELKRHCKLQEKRIEELEKICDEADESEAQLKKKIAELEKEIAGEKEEVQIVKPMMPRLLDALRERKPETIEEETCQVDAYSSAPSSPECDALHRKDDATMLKEPEVEDSATPDRTLGTTLHAKLNKTRKLTETVEETREANTSRCAQQ